MCASINLYLSKRLEERDQANNKRQLTQRQDGIDFYSNDYLGLAKAEHANISSYDCGSTGSRLLSGNSIQVVNLEKYLADFHQTEGSLVFNSGYDANVGLISAIANRHTTILYDEYAHASIIDGIRLSFCKQSFRFGHNNTTDLEIKLKRYSDALLPLIVIVESVYSMEGDIAPLTEIVSLCKKYNADLIVDEAHATGVCGNKGEGIVQQLQLQNEVFARVHTFGKALGVHGAVVVGNSLLINYLTNFARPFIYTTALPPHTITVIQKNYQLMENDKTLREKLHTNIQYFNRHKKNIGDFYWKESISPIQSLIMSNNEQTKDLAMQCRENGLLISAILSPTVAKGEERIRVCLHSFNTTENIDHLFNSIQSCLEK